MAGKKKTFLWATGLVAAGVFSVSGMYFLALAYGGDGPATTDTKSDTFATHAEKVEFLKRYVVLKRTYDEVDFHIHYRNNPGGLVPGPSEWDIRVIARVPRVELALWSKGLDPVEAPEARFKDLSWIKTLPGSVVRTGRLRWYRSLHGYVGIDEENSVVVYWNWVM